MKSNQRKLETIAPLDLAGVAGGHGWWTSVAQQAAEWARRSSLIGGGK
jgi:hypothetical protein